jgi:hypothetical protein
VGLLLMSRQQRRAKERAAAKATLQARIHTRIESAVSVHRMWRTFYDEVLVPRGITFDDPDTAPGVDWFRRAFYAGAASMLDLMMRVGPDDVSEDQGVEMLERLREELETFGKGLA